ncbi:sugar ABC transporter permease [Listeria fleischmannii 1991]|jgi:multiple sugar transport system permease protein|uniref:sn-glycerol-3-phosphate transport system permease protein ugpA n=3 Tax=Listeria fleischmannii TaxID=1069827 RepID=A0A2X3H6B1_9LIST|nr:sugar ABC transporter permease [Listeria fleischmannii]EIA21060.1 sugar ABC transporter permease [Listeria fleischmannii subsp. coloradonensis]EMG27809.1 sugar ABC transporter permease [Listeria fleischmannii subsp. fleischmannii LU2006-1]KMT58317.1 sugar ABC transporter permease [Listeria fleischmannii 1991]MBC1397649.1 sugar ABC transporter permease [Listeria fleischmannii]MBC1417700.1 sugar ABC transporter permease [Listeria fleischmannii]
MKNKNNKLGWFFTSPYLIFTAIFFLIPLVWAIWLSLTDWNMMSPDINFVGLDNFKKALTSKSVHAAFFVTYKFLIVFVPMALLLSMLVAVLVNGLPRFKGLYLVAFFLPYLSSGVVTSLIVKGLLSYNSPLNVFLRNQFGLDVDWLGTPMSALFIISLMIAWKMSGYYALILISGLASINDEIYEAAAMDGSGRFRTFWKVTIPMLYPALFTVLVLAVGVSFGIFTEVYQLTGGGPNFATNTWQMEIYNQAFINLKSGYASAISLIAAVVTFASIGVIKKLLEKWGERNGWT